MTPRAFDAIARRAAQALNRRALLGVAFGAAFTIVKQPLPTFGKKDPHDGGGGQNGGGGGNNGGGNNNKKDKDKDKEKKCQKQGTACIAAVAAYCNEHYFVGDPLNDICLFAHHECCALYKKCKTAKADQCIQRVPF